LDYYYKVDSNHVMNMRPQSHKYDVLIITSPCCINCSQLRTRSHPEMVGDISRVTFNFDLSKIPCVRF